MNVGILGAGQLGRMLALAGYPLGLHFRVYDQAEEAPAEHVADFVQGRFDDLEGLASFASGLDVITYEFENVPVVSLEFLAQRVPVLPGIEALAACQHRLSEKALFSECGIKVPKYVAIHQRSDLEAGIKTVGQSAVLKSCRLGYDGKGQTVIRSADGLTLDQAWRTVGESTAVLEQFIDFERELSILAVRAKSGAMSFYPLVENVHHAGILRTSRAPAPAVAHLQPQAEEHARRVMERLGYVGVLAIEFFQIGSELLANEAAPRVHNSGHWTIEGATTSQFENHVRAICGLPLGPTEAIGHSMMFNLIGSVPDLSKLLAVDGAHVHLYGKAPRPGRKLGHVTVWAACAESTHERAELIRDLIEPSNHNVG